MADAQFEFDGLDYDGLLYVWQAKIKPALAAKANSTDLPTKVSELTNDTGFITSSSLPTKVSDLTNDTGFITSSSLPTKVSDLQNDSNFQTSTQVSSAINAAISNIEKLTIDWSYQELPVSGQPNIIYAIKVANTGDTYDFYIWNNADSVWVQLDFNVDLSNYVQKSQVKAITNAQIDTIFAS